MNCQIEKPQTDPSKANRTAYRRPRYNVEESEHAYTVAVQVPGVNKSGVEVSLENTTLTLTATRNRVKPSESARVLRREIADADYRLNLEVNVPVSREGISAQVVDGVLTLTLPKAEEAKPRRIEVN